ncbi:MAG: hypothetical protein GY805_18340, partial [Chloroflexi bacterium]|nr:hypothetical protein [Chloroflexota bacterium]
GEVATAARRLLQANYVAGLAAERLASDAEAAVIVLGDFNDYEQSPPLLALAENEYLQNVLLRLPDETRYSFVFAGVSQLIDAIFVTPSLQDSVAEVMILHVNADFPDVLGVDVSPDALPFKTTDHDLPLLVLQLDSLPTLQPSVTLAATAVSNVSATAVATSTPVTEDPTAPITSFSWLWWLAAGLLVGVGGTAVFLKQRWQ